MGRKREVDVAVMGSGVAGMGAAYKLANAGGLCRCGNQTAEIRYMIFCCRCDGKKRHDAID